MDDPQYISVPILPFNAAAHIHPPTPTHSQLHAHHNPTLTYTTARAHTHTRRYTISLFLSVDFELSLEDLLNLSLSTLPSRFLSHIQELLKIDPFFATPEPDVDDPQYISVLILLFNAAAHFHPHIHVRTHPEAIPTASLCVYEEGLEALAYVISRSLSSPAHISHTLTQELLKIDPFFATPEPDVDDPQYISVLILLFNAAAHNIRIPALCPVFTRSHFAYLRDKWPSYFPHMQVRVCVCVCVG